MEKTKPENKFENLEDKKSFDNFFVLMKKGIEDNKGAYGDSWKHQDVEDMGFDFLSERLAHKLKEFTLTKNPHKLVSLSNLAMLLYVREMVLKKKREY